VILNVSTYRFVALPEAADWVAPLKHRAQSLGLRGTVLLAEEGINLFLAGAADSVNAWLDALRQDPRFADLPAKESWSDTQPFQRLKVKFKREIIRMDCPTVRPALGRAPALPAATLKRWLDQGHDDEGRPVAMLDTRNAFEVDAGAFEGAVDWRLNKFTDFPAALRQHATDLAGRTVVSYCTGGIRCEKAALLMHEALPPGTPVYQLEGGILKYFEEVGGAHYRGHCFVFDERGTLDPQLQPSPGA
jgi:UPF0176 protein